MKTIFAPVLAALVLALPSPARTDDGPAPAQDKPAGDRVDQAIKRAIDFLVSQQDKDGAIHEPNANHNLTAMTSMAIMAMAAVGHQPADDTPQGAAMKKALSYVLRPDALQINAGLDDAVRQQQHAVLALHKLPQCARRR